MLREALEFCAELVTKNTEATPLDVPGVNTKSIVVLGGEVHEYAHEPSPREHTCHDVESFGGWCGDPTNTIWYCMDRLFVLLEDTDSGLRRDHVSMPLTRSLEWTAAMVGISAVPQSQFVRWVLDYLDRNIEAASPGLLQTARQLKFASSETGEGKIANGAESFGNSITAEVSGAKGFPDDITVSVLVWAELDIKVEVRMAFIVNPHESTLTLRALPASQQQATRSALSQLGEVLAEHQGESQLFCGTP